MVKQVRDYRAKGLFGEISQTNWAAELQRANWVDFFHSSVPNFWTSEGSEFLDYFFLTNVYCFL